MDKKSFPQFVIICIEQKQKQKEENYENCNTKNKETIKDEPLKLRGSSFMLSLYANLHFFTCPLART